MIGAFFARDRRAFTLVELLVTIGVLAVLLSVALVSLHHAREHARRSACLSNLRQIWLACQVYAQGNEDQLLAEPGPSFWLWDISIGTRNAIVGSDNDNSPNRHVLYCPSGDLQDNAGLYTFRSNPAVPIPYSVIGYQILIRRNLNGWGPMPVLLDDDGNPAPDGSPHGYQLHLLAPDAPDRVVACDTVVDTNDNYADVRGDWPMPLRSNHLRNQPATLAAGGNCIFLDGHGSWRNLSEMKVRAYADAGPAHSGHRDHY